MKKIYYIVIAIIGLCVYDNVCAEYSVTRDESTLLAKCVYDMKDNSGASHKIILDITKDYNIGLAYTDIFTPVDSGNIQAGDKLIGFSYEMFIDDDGKLDCNLLDKIYYYTYGESIGGRGTKNLHCFDSDLELETSVPYYVKPTECLLNESESKIYVTDNYDEEVMKEEGWLKICHYGSYHLKFNEKTYNTNIDGLMEGTGYHADPLNVITYLSSINYTCPTSLCSHERNGLIKHTFKMEYDKKCITSQDFVSEYRCGSLEFHMRDYENLKNDGSIALLNEKIEKIKKFCDSVYQNQDYDDPTYCAKECFEIDEIFKEDMNLDGSGECGFSERLIYWIANIIRWVKYIVPVAVIVLGILDFMKAISADKEDEMKKAQQRFIRRLIAAALIFIAPFIIEFILNKLGFDANGCGIINL